VELSQEPDELVLLTRAQRGDDSSFVVGVVRDGCIDGDASGRGERHQHLATIIWALRPRDESSLFEPVEPIRHRSRGDHRRLEKLAGGELMRFAGAQQCCEDVELPRLEPVGGENVVE
jgi:hypothetical protein